MSSFQYYDPIARAVIVAAGREAIRMDLAYLGCESILLGCLIVEEGLASQVLRSLGVTLEEARRFTEAGLRLQPARSGSRPRQIPYTHTAKKAVENAVREALRAEAKRVSSEHLLLAVLAEDSMATVVLEGFSLTPGQVRRRVQEHVQSDLATHDPSGEMPLSKLAIMQMIGGMVVAGHLTVDPDLPTTEAEFIAACVKAFTG